jgi:hypothetical protein
MLQKDPFLRGVKKPTHLKDDLEAVADDALCHITGLVEYKGNRR